MGKPEKFIYRYDFTGEFCSHRIKNGQIETIEYMIQTVIPIDYSSKEDAIHCSASLRFEMENDHIVLRIYDKWQQGINQKGQWFESVDGNAIETIEWSEWWRYHICYHNMDELDSDDFYPDATPWDEIFALADKKEGWHCTVSPLAYSIEIYESN